MGYRTFSTDSVLLDITDPARNDLEGWSEIQALHTTGHGEGEEAKSTSTIDRKTWSHHLSMVRSPCLPDSVQSIPGCGGIGVKRKYVTGKPSNNLARPVLLMPLPIPYPDFRSVLTCAKSQAGDSGYHLAFG